MLTSMLSSSPSLSGYSTGVSVKPREGMLVTGETAELLFKELTKKHPSGFRLETPDVSDCIARILNVNTKLCDVKTYALDGSPGRLFKDLVEEDNRSWSGISQASKANCLTFLYEKDKETPFACQIGRFQAKITTDENQLRYSEYSDMPSLYGQQYRTVVTPNRSLSAGLDMGYLNWQYKETFGATVVPLLNQVKTCFGQLSSLREAVGSGGYQEFKDFIESYKQLFTSTE
ncbi:MAG: hypothetical protein ACKO34_03820, partial [Vampirovibrionales bacterium]